MNNKGKDIAASARQQLLNLAKDRGENFDLVLTRYGLERLLYRLSRSQFVDQFILKGAMLFSLWSVNNRVREQSGSDCDSLLFKTH